MVKKRCQREITGQTRYIAVPFLRRSRAREHCRAGCLQRQISASQEASKTSTTELSQDKLAAWSQELTQDFNLVEHSPTSTETTPTNS